MENGLKHGDLVDGTVDSVSEKEVQMSETVNEQELKLCGMMDAIPARLGLVFQRDADLVSWEWNHMEFADLDVEEAISVSEEVVSTWLVAGEGPIITCVGVRKYSNLMDKIERRMVDVMDAAERLKVAEVTDTP